jgi:pimeloyl-ACP methyl ester carboxylesterase
MFHQIDDHVVRSFSLGTGPTTFVGIAGSFADWEVWAPSFERLSPHTRCIGFDHDGVGLTTTPIDQITHSRHIDTLFSVLDAQGVDRCVLAGHSVNASVALDAVLRQPERFDGLVLANGHAWDMDRPEIKGFVEALRTDFAPTVEFFTHLVLPEPDAETARIWLTRMMHRTGPDACARILESKYPVNLRSLLGQVTVPTLVVHGALDAVSPDSFGEATTFAREIPDATLHVIEEAGHMPLLSRPDAFADAVSAFLTRPGTKTSSTSPCGDGALAGQARVP